MRARRLIAIAALLSALPACTRRTELVPASADSTRATPDSFTVAVHRANLHWEAGENDAAANETARALLVSMKLRPSAPWADRARGLLDSLGIAAEVAGGDKVLAVNLFSRSDPEGPSWPLVFWRETGGPRFQSIEGRGLKLGDTRGMGFTHQSVPADTAQLAVLWARRVGGGEQPVLMVWRHAAGGRWDLSQTLDADSLGGTGTGEFADTDSVPDLTTRTYRATPYFDECASCPHVFHERRFAWGRAGFSRMDDRLVPSPYLTFTTFISALVAGNRDLASAQVVDPSLIEFARRLDWHTLARGRWRVAPATDESALTLVFFRGSNDAYRITFESRERDWVIAGFEPTSRSLE